jgi:hypothetical protein
MWMRAVVAAALLLGSSGLASADTGPKRGGAMDQSTDQGTTPRGQDRFTGTIEHVFPEHYVVMLRTDEGKRLVFPFSQQVATQLTQLGEGEKVTVQIDPQHRVTAVQSAAEEIG